MADISEYLNNEDYELILIELPHSFKTEDLNNKKILEKEKNELESNENNYILNYEKKSKILNKLFIVNRKENNNIIINKKISKFFKVKRNLDEKINIKRKSVIIENIKGIDN